MFLAFLNVSLTLPFTTDNSPLIVCQSIVNENEQYSSPVCLTIVSLKNNSEVS